MVCRWFTRILCWLSSSWNPVYGRNFCRITFRCFYQCFFKVFRRVSWWSFRVSIRFSLLCLTLLSDFHKNASFNTPNYLNTTFTFDKKKDNFINRKLQCTYSFLHSFSCPLFLWGGGSRGGSSSTWTRNTSRLTAVSQSPLGPHKVEDVVTAPGSWTSRLMSHRCSQQDLPRISFLADSGNMARPRSWDLSNRKSGVTFRALRISNLCILSRSVTPWTLRTNPISAACSCESIPLVVTWGWWPQTRIETKTKRKALRSLKAPVFTTEQQSSRRTAFAFVTRVSIPLFRFP